MQILEFGDIIEVKFSFFGENWRTDHLGLVYYANDNWVQVLCMGTCQDTHELHTAMIRNADLAEGKLGKDYLVMTDRMMLLKEDSIVQKVGKISIQKTDEILRQMTKNIVERHYNLVHLGRKAFIPGKTYIGYAGRVYDAEDMKSLIDSSLDFWLTAGRFSKQFEEEFTKFLGVKYCTLTNSGSSANLLAISSLTSLELGERRLKPGDEVVTVACAFPTTVNPIVQNNLVPVFLDIDLGTYNVQVDKIEDAVSDRTRALFLPHTLGNPFDLDEVLEVCKKRDLWLIEDSCDALGSKYNGKYAGTFGHVATFSFYPPHHITMGEGGALVTNDAVLRRLFISFRDWGRDCWCEPGHDNTCGKRFQWQLSSLPYGYDHKYIYSHIGYNLKISDMQAAVGVAQLEKLPGFIEARKRNWRHLCEGLKKYEDYFILPSPSKHSDPSWFGFVLTIKEGVPFSRNELVNHLEENKVATRLLFSGNIIRHPCFEGVKYRVHGRLKNTDFITENTFWIGVYPGITEEMIEYILEQFYKFLRNK